MVSSHAHRRNWEGTIRREPYTDDAVLCTAGFQLTNIRNVYIVVSIASVSAWATQMQKSRTSCRIVTLAHGAGVDQILRLSGLEPFSYVPASNMRDTFMYIGERCNVAGSIIYKKAIVDGNYEKAASIALKQVRLRYQSLICASDEYSSGRKSSLAMLV